MEHPFLYVKRHFGYAKVRYRGLAKNTQRLMLLLGLANLEKLLLCHYNCLCQSRPNRCDCTNKRGSSWQYRNGRPVASPRHRRPQSRVLLPRFENPAMSYDPSRSER